LSYWAFRSNPSLEDPLIAGTSPSISLGPFGFGIIKEQTGSVIPGLFALAAASTIAAGLVYFLKERKSEAAAGHVAAPEEAPAFAVAAK